ncbi:metallophosphoesterase [Deinococcus arenicola]|uniref:Metallophosphoesterase n=1 Tax=Deinococcus arenicola TaxID=2994950 RepID=A0ABU4DMM7_9DEIO|nr:metallophosphoesterase [Deinococcus sp. ZS9-10]MDV6373692.1 metallophosphoesterase [Deinococcus sp. ZS9-10]
MKLLPDWTPAQWDGSWLVVPDLHGHAARLDAALKVAAKRPGSRLAFLGDLIDDSLRRREARKARPNPGSPDDSRAIIQRVRQLTEMGRAEVVLGNHEIMAMATVLEGHRPLMDVWWRVGGREAAASYGWKGKGEAGELAEDLRWLREHGRLWLSVGPPGAEVLLSHATRPSPSRYLSGQNRAADLTPSAANDEVVWLPLGRDSDNGARLRSLPPLPDGFTASLHGHMETPDIWTLLDTQDIPAYQLDLHPGQRKLALMQVGSEGKLTPQVVRIG